MESIHSYFGVGIYPSLWITPLTTARIRRPSRQHHSFYSDYHANKSNPTFDNIDCQRHCRRRSSRRPAQEHKVPRLVLDNRLPGM
jgi:hypothetical protein